MESLVMNVPCSGKVIGIEEKANAHAAVDEGWLTEGRWAARFEAGLRKYLGREHVRLTNSGSSANLLAVSALQLQPGDEVVTVACGFPTTIAPVIQNHGVPVFVDVRRDTANIDVSRLEDAWSSRTVAVMLAHTLGVPFDVGAVVAFCKRHGLTLIEDNCDALGSRFACQLTGTFGDIATSSFYPAHHITTGEGGAVYTSNERLDTLIASYRDWGRSCYCKSGKQNTCGKRFDQQFGTLPDKFDHKYVYERAGFHLAMGDLQASVGVAQLAKIEEFGAARRTNHRYLREHLEPLGVFDFQEPTPRSDPSWFGLLLTVKESAPFSRAEVVAHLEQAKIHTRPLFAGSIVRQPWFDSLTEGRDYRVVGDLANSDRFMRDAFWVGCWHGLTRDQLDYMVERFGEFAALRKARP